MFKRINIILCLFLISSGYRIYPQDNFELFVPEIIPSNTSFEICFKISNRISDAAKFEIFFLPDNSLSINTVLILTQDQRLQIPLHSEYVDEYESKFQKISILLNDTTLFFKGSVFQIILNLKATPSTKSSLKFFGYYLKENDVKEYFISSDLSRYSAQNHLYSIELNQNQKIKEAGKSISVKKDAYFNLPLVYRFDESLVVEFWIKINVPVSTFLKLINWETNRVEYLLSINENQLLGIYDFLDELLPCKPYFISQNVWYHFMLRFDKNESELSIYCNGFEIGKYLVPATTDFENLLIHFQNENEKSEINIDQLRIINLSGSISEVLKNKNNSKYSGENSSVILQLDFSSDEMESLLNEKIISFEGISFKDSDAPIFPKALELSFKILDNYYEIIWTNRDDEEIERYVIERAIGDKDFTKIGEVKPNSNEINSYSFLCEKNNQSDIIYFRIKKINKNASVDYSEIIKIGQGTIEDIVAGQNFPNPFNPTTLIEFELLQDSDVEVKIYNLAGNEISVLHKGFLNKGNYIFTFDASGFPSGVYLYQISTPLSSQTRKMILAK